MKYTKRGMLAVVYILISVMSFLSLSGCRHWDRKDRDSDRHHDERGELNINLRN